MEPYPISNHPRKITKTVKVKKSEEHLPLWQILAREEKKRKRSKKVIYFDNPVL